MVNNFCWFLYRIYTELSVSVEIETLVTRVNIGSGSTSSKFLAVEKAEAEAFYTAKNVELRCDLQHIRPYPS